MVEVVDQWVGSGLEEECYDGVRGGYGDDSSHGGAELVADGVAADDDGVASVDCDLLGAACGPHDSLDGEHYGAVSLGLGEPWDPARPHLL